jgi:Tfp pilus assembly protein FimT
MIVVTILGFVAVLSVPTLLRSMPRHRVRQAADRLQMELRAIRTLAISRTQPIFLTLDASTRTLRSAWDRNRNGKIEKSEISKTEITSRRQIDISATATWGRFKPDGSFTCPNGYWRVSMAGRAGGQAYVYLFPNGQAEQSETRLD